MTIIVAGTIGRSGLGGQVWAVLQYLLGLRAFGYDVYYLEDCGISSWAYDWDKSEWTDDPKSPAAYVHSSLEPFGFGDRWAYRTNDGVLGMSLDELLGVCRRADLLIVRGVPLWVWREEYDRPKRRAFIDVDPGFTQAAILSGDKGIADGVAHCERRFTVGQCVGLNKCKIPQAGGPWQPTVPPVYLDEWPNQWPSDRQGEPDFTSVIRWQGFREQTFDGKVYGQRDRSFPKFFGMPSKLNAKFRIALLGTEPETLTRHGWEVVPGEVISKTPEAYREFIQQSRAEFCVPKHGYVAMWSGWVSDRSICYLASGRPVLMEETGISERLPTGLGIVTFKSFDEAVVLAREIQLQYERHSRAAHATAQTVFSTHNVLPHFLNAAMG
jgi:hypothetical protein